MPIFLGTHNPVLLELEKNVPTYLTLTFWLMTKTGQSWLDLEVEDISYGTSEMTDISRN